ncbi:MAG: lipase maturation factor family protein, partial [Myxococcales bacterium]|nr:lipase maturation factor family protein [Myxococcales bacterium]
RQLVPLVGHDGLLPADRVIDELVTEAGGAGSAARRLPTVFLFTGVTDTALAAVAWLGVIASLFVVLGGTHAGVMLVLWVLYLSIVQVGQEFYSYGWEIQLCETGILAVFLCPWRSVRPFASQPPAISLWLYRWLIVRVMLGAGLIKLRGDDCWRDFTCLHYHYETQPIPGPLSPAFHALPKWLNGISVGFNHVVELIAPFFAFGPRPARCVAGILFLVFQLTLIVSGNLAFLNWLTLVPAIACFDDDDLRRVLPARFLRWAEAESATPPTRAAIWAVGGYALVVAMLSLNPVANLVSSRQAMNRSFEPLHLVNTYGAFGSINRERLEVVVQGSMSEDPEDDTGYVDYELPCKPGPTERGLCWITPYHLRLDWQMWFLPFSEADQNPWFIHFVGKLLDGDSGARRLLARDPFGGAPPRWVRAGLYRYSFDRDGSSTWKRDYIGVYLRPVANDDPALESYLESLGFR